MPISVTLDWDEYERMQKQAAIDADIVRHASNWEIARKRGEPMEMWEKMLEESVRKLRLPEYR